MVSLSKMSTGARGDDFEFGAGGTCLKYLDKGYKMDDVMSTNNTISQNKPGLDVIKKG